MIPVRLELSNFQAYNSAELDFDFKSALIIGERDNDTNNSNAVGKSSLLDSIAWALFGKSKHKNADSVVKRGQEVCEVRFAFTYGNDVYRVERKRNARFSRTDVSFYKIVDGTEILVQGDTNKDIDLKIRETIHSNYDVFLSSCYFRQNSVNDFMTSTPSDKQRLLGSMLNLEKWNKKADSAKVRLNHILKDIDNYSFKIKGMENLENDLAQAQLEFGQKKEALNSAETNHINLSNEIKILEGRVNDMRMAESKLIDYHDIMAQLENAELRLGDINSSLSSKKRTRIDLLSQIDKTAAAIDEFNLKITDLSNHLALKGKVDIAPLEASILNGNAKLASVLQELSDWQPEKICECCGKPNSSHTDRVERHNLLKEQEKEIASKLELISNKLQNAKLVMSKIKESEIEIEKYSQKIRGLTQTLEIDKLKCQSVESDICNLEDALKEKQDQVETLKSKVSSLQKISDTSTYEQLRTQLKQTKEEEEKTVDVRNKLMYDVGVLSQKVTGLVAAISEKNQLLETLESLKHESAIFTNVVKSFGRTGIQAVIIDNVIDEWTKIANNWLAKFCYEPTYVKVITQKSDGKGGWKESFDIEVHTPSGISDFDSLSGGEAFKVAFAMRVSLAQVQARRMGGHAQLLLLDEVSTALDRQGRETFVALIRQLEKEMKILVITHDDHLKEEFDNIITVKRTGSDSTLSV